MGLDDLVDDTKTERKEEEASDTLERLGADSLEELENAEDRLSGLGQTVVILDRKVEELEDEIKALRGLLEQISTEEKEKKEDDNGWNL